MNKKEMLYKYFLDFVSLLSEYRSYVCMYVYTNMTETVNFSVFTK
jgi:hypothetical protein